MDSTIDNGEETNRSRATAPECEQRVMQVQQWLKDGVPPTQIIKMGMRQWNIQKSRMYEYLGAAHQEFMKAAGAELESRRQCHIEMRMQLLQEIVAEKQPNYVFGAAYLLKDIAQLEGLYAKNPVPKNQDVHVTMDLGTNKKFYTNGKEQSPPTT